MTHLLRQDLHVMVCAGLMRRDAEMTNLHPDLGETRRQELRNSPFLPSPLFHSQLVQEGEEFLLKKGSSKSQSQTKIGPFVALREAEDVTENTPMDNLSLVVQPLQTEVVSVAEVAGASSDPIAGVGVVETPQNNDSHRDPPVGGRPIQFRRAWVDENCSSSVLNIIRNGYVLPFHLKPKLTRHPLIISEYKNQQRDQALAFCIQSLLHKDAIENVRNTESLEWRPVIDLSRLNQFLRIERFKMETPESIRTSLNTGEWVTYKTPTSIFQFTQDPENTCGSHTGLRYISSPLFHSG